MSNLRKNAVLITIKNLLMAKSKSGSKTGVSKAAKNKLIFKKKGGTVGVFVEENGPTFVEWSQKQKGVKLEQVFRTNIFKIQEAATRVTKPK